MFISKRAHQFAYLILIGGFLGLTAALALTRVPGCDEAWFFSPIYNFFHGQGTGTTVLESAGRPWEGLEKYTFWQVPVFFVAEGIWMKLFGLHLLALRSLVIVCGVVSVLAWREILARLGMERGALLLATALIAWDYGYLTRSVDGRMDMLSAMFGVTGLACYLRLRESRFTLAIGVSQTLLMLSALSHPVGGSLNLLGFLFFLLRDDLRKIRWFHIPLAAAPYLAGLAGWWLYISQDPQLFVKVFSSNTANRLDGLRSPLVSLKREIVERYFGPYGLRSPGLLAKPKLVIPVIFFAGVAATLLTRAVRRNEASGTLLKLLGIYFAALMFQDNLKFGNYLVHIFPLYAAVLAGWIAWAWRNQRLPRVLLGAFVAAFLALQLSGAVYWVVKNPYARNYLPAVAFLRGNVKPAELIMGPAELAFELGFDTNLIDDTLLGYHGGKTPVWIVVDGRYREDRQILGRLDPRIEQHISRRLTEEYRTVYDVGGYQILKAVSAPPASGAR